MFARWANDLHSANDNMNDILFLEGSLQKLETTILPTLGDKWVSLHPSFGLVCWVDDNELMQHFEDYNGVNFIQFGELSYEDKQLLYGRIAALLKSLGIPALSKVIKILFWERSLTFFIYFYLEDHSFLSLREILIISVFFIYEKYSPN